jgi:hypothetical protein
VIGPRLEQLAGRLPRRFLTRFAPSPTGRLHLGHAVNAIYVWGIARALGGRVLLRIEDHDRQRSRKAHERAILDAPHSSAATCSFATGAGAVTAPRTSAARFVTRSSHGTGYARSPRRR